MRMRHWSAVARPRKSAAAQSGHLEMAKRLAYNRHRIRNDCVPRICQFYGIAIYLYYRDHAPPHFHAIYAEHEAEVAIETGEIIDGELPRKASHLVAEWAEAHLAELRHNWNLARAGQPLQQIEPLQ